MTLHRLPSAAGIGDFCVRLTRFASPVGWVSGVLFSSHLLAAGLAGATLSSGTPQGRGEAGDAVWQVVAEETLPAQARRTNIVGQHAVVRLNKTALDAALAGAPLESAGPATLRTPVLALPLPDGRFGRFRVVQTATLAPELAAAFPEIKTYHGSGVDDPTASAAFGWTAAGFHALILAAGGSTYIDPYAPGELAVYVVYRQSDLRNDRHDGPR